MLKKIMMLMLIITSIMAISSNNWPLLWIMMEMNSYSFISYIKQYSDNKSLNLNMMTNPSNPCMTYFYVSFLASILMISAIMLSGTTTILPIEMNETSHKITFISGVMLKLGAAPFQSWIYQMAKNISTTELSILLTIQKIIPIYLLSTINSNLVILVSIMSVIASASLTNFSLGPTEFLVTSSLNSTSWVLITSMMNTNTTWMFFMIYSMVILMMAKELKHSSKSSMTWMPSNQWNTTILTLSLIGFPPLLGFLPKMLAIQEMSKTGLNMIVIILLTGTIYMAWLYFSSMATMNLSMMKQKKSKVSNMVMISQLTLPSMIMMSMMMN